MQCTPMTAATPGITRLVQSAEAEAVRVEVGHLEGEVEARAEAAVLHGPGEAQPRQLQRIQ